MPKLTKKSSGRNKSVTFFAIAKNAPLLSAAYFGVSFTKYKEGKS